MAGRWTPDDDAISDGQTTENVDVCIDADPDNRLTYSFGQNETVLAYGPIISGECMTTV